MDTLNRQAYFKQTLWSEHYLFLEGSQWTIQNRSFQGGPAILLSLRNGASNYTLVLDCNNNPGLYDMVQFLATHQVEPAPLHSEVIMFKEGDENGNTDFSSIARYAVCMFIEGE